MKNLVSKIAKTVSATAVTLYAGATSAFALSTGDIGAGVLKSGKDLPGFVLSLLNWAIGLIALIAVVMLIWSGVQYITAGGDEGKVEKATKGITNAIIGLVICFLSVLIVNFVIAKIMNPAA
jgi:TRAP-type C4-dicarboxylate transport system permease small subunit